MYFNKYIIDDYRCLGKLNPACVDIRISFNIMVKDEARCIRRCLDSIILFADEIVIADTGSKDSTLEIISNYKSEKIKLFHFKWNDDFSEVRNFMLAKSTYSAIFQIDADEYIECHSDINGDSRK